MAALRTAGECREGICRWENRAGGICCRGACVQTVASTSVCMVPVLSEPQAAMVQWCGRRAAWLTERPCATSACNLQVSRSAAPRYGCRARAWTQPPCLDPCGTACLVIQHE